ncbi:MAG: helix-turn-helix transcriptional regulator, partial [Spirochaetota bacterium]
QLTTVAEHCTVSPSYLSRLFSERLGTSFNDYLNTVRLGVAQRLLELGKQSVKEIALSVGYHDPNYFSRIFKKFVGVSPTSFTQREEVDG